MRLAAQWTDSYPVAEFWFIWADKLGLPEYPTVYITLAIMLDWSTAKVWSVLGALFSLVGFFLIARVDLLQTQATEASDAVRDTQFVDVYHAANTGVEYEPSTQEVEARQLSAVAGRKGFGKKVGLALAAFGVTLQLVAAVIAN